MAKYSIVVRRMWDDSRFRSLSSAQPNAQTLWIRLLTGPENSSIPGAIRIRKSSLAEELGWTSKGLGERFSELFQEGMAKADWEAGLVWIPKAIYHNPPANGNVVKSWREPWREIPECALKSEVYQDLSKYSEGAPEWFAKAFGELFRNGMANGIPNGMPNHEHEHEHDLIPPIVPLRNDIDKVWDAFNDARKRRYPDGRTTKLNDTRRAHVKARLNDVGLDRVLAAVAKFHDPQFFWAIGNHAKQPTLLFRSLDQFEKVESAETWGDKPKQPTSRMSLPGEVEAAFHHAGLPPLQNSTG